MLSVGAVSYPIFATWVMAETRKSYWHCGQQVPFHNYYGRDQKKLADILNIQNGMVYSVQMKKTRQPGRAATR